MRRKMACALFAGVLLVGLGGAVGGEKIKDDLPDIGFEEPPVLPGEWAKIPVQQRLLATRFAEVDALTLLAERVYGLRIDASTIVHDLVYGDDRVHTQLIANLRWAMPGKNPQPTYSPEGIVHVIRRVTIRDVIEVIKRTIRRTKNPLRIKEEKLVNISRETVDREIRVVGNSAVPGTPAALMVQAKRAAELDAYRKLAEIIATVRVTRDTTLGNLMLASDRMTANVLARLRWAKTTKVRYRPDGSAAVTMQITMRDIIETVQASTKRYANNFGITEKHWRKVTLENRDRVFTVTGEGVAKDAPLQPGPVPNGQPFFQETIQIRRRIRRVIGVPG